MRFREPSFWEQYYWRVMISAGVVLVQAMMIAILLRERRLRFLAEVEARQRMSEQLHESPCHRGRDVCHDRA